MRIIDVCDINPKTQAIDDSIEVSFVAMSDVSEDGKINTGIIRQYREVKKGFTCFREGDVLFAKITPCMENGKGALALGLKNGIGCGSTEFHVLRPNTEVIQGKWLYYLTSWSAFRKDAERHMTGSAGQKRVPKAFLEKYELQIPTLSEQSFQAEVLDRTKAVIELRKRELQNLDDLIKARFVEMFGDPVTNPKGWETYQLNDCLKRIDSGKSFVCSDKPRVGDYPAVLKLSASTYGDYRPEENKALLDENQFVEGAEVHSGDLLFTRKNTPELVGMAAYVQETPEKLMMPDLIFRLVTNDRMNPVFLWQLINCKEFRPIIQGISGGSAKSMSNISKERLGRINVVCPPRHIQNQLVQFVHQVDKSKSEVQAALDKTQLLLDSLMQQYFG